MKKRIKAADLKFYNANSRGNHTGDCVKRAISLAFDVSYPETGKLLNQKMHDRRQTQWNIMPVYRRVIEDLGGGNPIQYEGIITVDQFADEVAKPGKIYILETGKKPGQLSHLCCIRDGKVWDSWDSRKYFVDCYFEIDGSDRRAIRDTDSKFMEGLSSKYAEPAVQAEIERYASKKGLEIKGYDLNAIGNDYKIKIDCSLAISRDEFIQKDRYYQFNVVLVMEPTWTKEEIIEFIKKTAKMRTYDRMYAINQEEKKLREAAEIVQQMGGERETPWGAKYLDKREQRFVNTLPGWVKPLLEYVNIQEPGQYYDSYTIEIKKLPGDTLHPDRKKLEFYDWDADGIRYMLDRYKKDYSVGGLDYDKDW